MPGAAGAPPRRKKGSRRHKKLARSRHRLIARMERQIRDMAHKGTRAVADFCAEHQVGEVFIGDPHGVRKRKCGKKHNQRMAQWEYGRDKNYLAQKLGRYGISSFTGSERGTSSRCPECDHKHKPKGRQWHCKACGFTGHRDLVGSVNMHGDNFQHRPKFPSLKDVTYLRPRTTSYVQAKVLGERAASGSSSRPDTGRGRCKPAELPGVYPAEDTNCNRRASQGAGHLGRLASGEALSL